MEDVSKVKVKINKFAKHRLIDCYYIKGEGFKQGTLIFLSESSRNDKSPHSSGRNSFFSK